MYIQIKPADCSRSKTVEVSKLTSVAELKSLVKGVFNVEPDRQRLFFGGKQLEGDNTLFDYCINLNDVVLLVVKPELSILETSAKSVGNSKECQKPSASNDMVESKYKVGDEVEAVDDFYGAWFEGEIVEIVKQMESVQAEAKQCNDSKTAEAKGSAENLDDQNDGLLYMVSLNVCSKEPPIGLPLKFIRPVMNILIKFTDIKVGQMVHVNYNIENPNERGFWYDMLVTEVSSEGESPKLIGTLFVGKERLLLGNCRIVFTNEVLRVTKPTQLLSQRSKEDNISVTTDGGHATAPVCSNCQGNPQRKCRDCACHVCGGKDEPERQLMCDQCNCAYHLQCLDPPLEALPDTDYWYCPDCKVDEKEIVQPGDKLKDSRKKKKLIAQSNAGKRDWGKGMACVGRTKNCTIVPPSHFGPVPGIDVGTCWMYRITLSESGIHRPPVAGIHGTGSKGAYSIVLSGGYEDDVDNGEEFLYTGSGGRDLKEGNKRTSVQSRDQELTRMNLSLAVNCNAPVNKNEGAEAEDWKAGKPVRVVRNYKLAKHSKYAPEEGNRYDGIYKVVKYYPERGHSGFLVWRYLLRRDDPSPPPWTDEGKKHIKSLGLTMIRPDGYEAMMAAKKITQEEAESAGSTESLKSAKRKINEAEELLTESMIIKKAKVAGELDVELDLKINQDEVNKKLWDACKISLEEGKMKFHDAVREEFKCICCLDLVVDPVTTTCNHNVCKECLRRSFLAQVYNCPCCRHELGKDFKLAVNGNLSCALRHMFNGYEKGR